MQNRFENPANGQVYDWQVNHSEEEEFGRSRAITRAATTSGVGMVRQQGEDGPLVLKLRGKILHRAQYQEMWRWFQLSRTQTIWFLDFDANRYEVQITAFTPKRVRKLANHGRDAANTPWHYWEYGMEMEVINVLWGDLVVAGVTP